MRKVISTFLLGAVASQFLFELDKFLVTRNLLPGYWGIVAYVILAASVGIGIYFIVKSLRLFRQIMKEEEKNSEKVS